MCCAWVLGRARFLLWLALEHDEIFYPLRTFILYCLDYHMIVSLYFYFKSLFFIPLRLMHLEPCAWHPE